MELKFIVEGSKGDEYEVIFLRSENNLNITCSCAAGENGLYCKHRFALMDGEVDDLLSDNEDDVTLIKKIISGTDVEDAYKKMIKAKEDYDLADDALKAAKKELAKAMHK